MYSYTHLQSEVRMEQETGHHRLVGGGQGSAASQYLQINNN